MNYLALNANFVVRKIALKSSIFLTLALFLVSFSSQAQLFDVSTYSYGVLYDVSGSHANPSGRPDIDHQLLHNHIMQEFKMKEDESTRNSAHMLFLNIGLPYIPKFTQSFIETDRLMFTPINTRLDMQKAFIANSNAYMADIFTQPADQGASNLYRGIAYALKYMDHSASERKMIICSDMLETVVVDLHAYAKEPTRIMEDYDMLKEKLIRADPLSNSYKGLHIVLIVPGESQLSFYATQFWTRFFGEYGISVEPRASYL